MTERLTRITTKKGDAGETSIASGEQLSKASLRINAIGEVDELNAALGLLVASLDAVHQADNELVGQVYQFCRDVQNELFNVGGELALPQQHFVSEEGVAHVDAFITKHNTQLPPLKEFVIPGQNLPSAHAHMVRCIARRAERSVVQLHQEEGVSSQLLSYLNRLSDAFFIVARLLGRLDSQNEPQWRR
ncbi:cob(I)yrinic acid a,c-diamide adenosyltransferase [Kangiella shandongensis]|uniref:cob(I)yrinic acid a,c-diamide adenosyltransferase n=1 Tax=Kangiella shandongensis TaxID=2763258 RepID=UPI001CBCBD9B|nr:cob(I)yrinic acid a,c-diamide adenosyltransferase [Kangiella shandongensis]